MRKLTFAYATKSGNVRLHDDRKGLDENQSRFGIAPVAVGVLGFDGDKCCQPSDFTT